MFVHYAWQLVFTKRILSVSIKEKDVFVCAKRKKTEIGLVLSWPFDRGGGANLGCAMEKCHQPWTRRCGQNSQAMCKKTEAQGQFWQKRMLSFLH